MNCPMNTKNSKHLQLDRGQVIKQVIKFRIFFSLLNALINRDNQLLSLFNCELSFGINYSMKTRCDEFLLK
jgi:hypothetical protein